MNDYKNNYPTLLIHGFAGWGEDDGMSRNKWEFFRIYDEMFEPASWQALFICLVCLMPLPWGRL